MSNKRTAICTFCEDAFTYEVKRGRPPTRCKDHLDQKFAPKKEKKIIEEVLDTHDEDGVPLPARRWGGPHGLGTIRNSNKFTKGDRVKISGENGTFKVHRDETNPDGSYVLYGGDANPNGKRSYRSIMPSRLSLDKRKKFIKEED